MVVVSDLVADEEEVVFDETQVSFLRSHSWSTLLITIVGLGGEQYFRGFSRNMSERHGVQGSEIQSRNLTRSLSADSFDWNNRHRRTISFMGRFESLCASLTVLPISTA